MTDTANRFLRQLDILSPEKLQFPIVVIGVGAIGSVTVVTLAKMGCSSLTVWDHDTLEEHNASNQLCRLDAIGKPKVEALAQLTLDLIAVSLQPICALYRGQRLQGVVIVAVIATRLTELLRNRLGPAPCLGVGESFRTGFLLHGRPPKLAEILRWVRCG